MPRPPRVLVQPFSKAEGRCSVSGSANLGAATYTIDFQGGTLHPTASFAIPQALTIEAGGGNVVVDPGISTVLASAVAAGGTLNVLGGGTLSLAASAVYTGNIIVTGNSALVLGHPAALSSAQATVSLDGARLTSTAPSTVNAHISLAPTGTAFVGGSATFDIPLGNVTAAGFLSVHPHVSSYLFLRSASDSRPPRTYPATSVRDCRHRIQSAGKP